MLAAQCGWIRLFESWDCQDTEGTLVYLSRDTTVNDVCRDLSISTYHSVWLQVCYAELTKVNLFTYLSDQAIHFIWYLGDRVLFKALALPYE